MLLAENFRSRLKDFILFIYCRVQFFGDLQ